MRTYEYEIGLSFVMVLGALVVYTLKDSISMLLGLTLGNSFGTCEGYLVRVSLITMYVFIIITGEGYFLGLSMGLPLGYQLESPDPVAELSVTLLGAHIGLWFGSEAARCLFCCFRLMDCHEATFWVVGIS